MQAEVLQLIGLKKRTRLFFNAKMKWIFNCMIKKTNINKLAKKYEHKNNTRKTEFSKLIKFSRQT